MGKWLDQLRDAITGPVERPSRTVMADELSGAAPPELQDSHGGLGGLWSTLKRADQYFSDNIGRAAADPTALLMGAANNARETVTLPREAWEGTIDPRSDEGIRRAFDMAGNVALGGRGTVAAVPAVAPEAGSIGMFIGQRSPMADQAALSRAQQLEAAGVHPDQVWKDTLWGRGADKEWRSEIDDRLSRLNISQTALGSASPENVTTLGQAFHHPKAYEAYPSMAEGLASLRMQVGDTGGSYSNSRPVGVGLERIDATSPTRHDLRSTVLHEMQHGIQQREDFAKGGNPEMMVPMANDLADPIAREAGRRIQAGEMTEDQALDWMMAQNEGNYAGQLYKRLAGEVESRNVQTRRDMTMDERRAQAPWETEDVPRERQIVRR